MQKQGELLAIFVPMLLNALCGKVVEMIPFVGIFLVPVVGFYFTCVVAQAVGQYCRLYLKP